MNLLGAIVEHQNSLVQLYRKLEERFEENSVVSTFWRDMSGDVSQQIQSSKSLPSSLWNQFKNAPDGGIVSVVKGVPSPPAGVSEISLRDAFDISLQLTEPVVLKIYARIVRLMRKNSTAPALNFYILVKAYVARLVRTVESFAGDPVLIRRAQLLLLGFEKEVQEPDPEIRYSTPRPLPASARKAPVTGKASAVESKKPTKIHPEKAKAAGSKPAKTTQVKIKTLPAKKPVTTKRG